MSQKSNNPQSIEELSEEVEISPDIQLNESLSWAGKLFFASLATYVAGDALTRKMPIKLKGSPDQVKAVVDAVVASKAFQQASKKSGASVDEIIKTLNLKNMNAKRFKELTGKPWPLG